MILGRGIIGRSRIRPKARDTHHRVRSDGKRRPADTGEKTQKTDSKDNQRLFHNLNFNKNLHVPLLARTNKSSCKPYCNSNMIICHTSQV
jgi:hypothetical protein